MLKEDIPLLFPDDPDPETSPLRICEDSQGKYWAIRTDTKRVLCELSIHEELGWLLLDGECHRLDEQAWALLDEMIELGLWHGKG